MSRPVAGRGQDLVDLAGDVALQATDDPAVRKKRVYGRS